MLSIKYVLTTSISGTDFLHDAENSLEKAYLYFAQSAAGLHGSLWSIMVTNR